MGRTRRGDEKEQKKSLPPPNKSSWGKGLPARLSRRLCLAHTEGVEEMVARKREIFGWSHDRLKNVEKISIKAQKNLGQKIFIG